MTAWLTVSPRYDSASRLSFCRMRALISWGVYFLPSMSTDHDVSPTWRLTERMVRSGLVMAWRLATSPTSTSPSLVNATTDGVVRAPSLLGMTTGSPASRTATTELVVPRSIPTALGILGPPGATFRRPQTEWGGVGVVGCELSLGPDPGPSHSWRRWP